ncbi:cytochrome c [Algoriphagus ratkowskyi]|uniref:C-type cytochrome n=1 Tax=Algoriphagus ratkowskyi TaxID=57028 RepID=A0A2W7SAK5_9BACT|nr:PQQ-dependent sugar dehydrogenase [Algoriphagus ratkowskyi]PZX59915.1 cytochrome c [Algoriphagus ratkowskyi]TXD78382.1 c-type cytochrome [Algoriphagus ratkowskyi]
MNKSLLPVLLVALSFFSCTKQNEIGAEISTNSEQIQLGKSLFEASCSTCHSFDQHGIGPNLSGVTHNVETNWIKNFIKDPSKVIASGDPRAVSLVEKYKTHMPSFAGLSEQELDDVLSYLHTFETLPDTIVLVGLKDPIPDSIADSGIYLEIEFFAQLPASDSKAPMAKMTKMEAERNSGRLFINDQRVGLYELINGNPNLYLPITELKPDLVSKPGWATGLASFTFHPEFDQNGTFFTSHTEPGGSQSADYGYSDTIPVFMQWVVTEWKANNPNAPVFAGSEKELLRIDIPSQAHGMQELTFNPHATKGDEDYGLLYIGFGDGGLTEKRAAYLSDSKGAKIYSSILRIDPKGTNSPNGKYGIPTSNPFAGVNGKAGEVYAYGFRNPNRIFWDRAGNMFATDIGQHSVEELNKIEPGKFYGWPIREGRFIINPHGNFRDVFELQTGDENLGITYPEIQLDHDELAAIFAGYEMPYGELKGKFIFGDILSGRLFFSDLKDLGNMQVQSWGVMFEGNIMTLREVVKNDRVDLKFGKDAQNNIYIMCKTEGKIYKIKE